VQGGRGVILTTELHLVSTLVRAALFLFILYAFEP
jgi:hypothetical protein